MTFNDISLDKNRIMFCKTSEPQVLNIIVCYMIDDSKNLKNVSYHYIEKKNLKDVRLPMLPKKWKMNNSL